MIWEIDTVNSYVDFSVQHQLVGIGRGRFNIFQGQIAFDQSDPARASTQVTIDTTSLDTKNARRDTDMKSENHFDVERFPTITFTSTSIESAGPDRLRVLGELTLKGVTRPVVLDAVYAGVVGDRDGGQRIGFSAHACLKRSEFGLVWGHPMEGGGNSLGEEINVTLEIQAKLAE